MDHLPQSEVVQILVAVVQILGVAADILPCPVTAAIPISLAASSGSGACPSCLDGHAAVVEPPGAHQGVQPLPLVLGMLLVSHLWVSAVGSPGCPPPQTTLGWPCIPGDPWQCCTSCYKAHQTIQNSSARPWLGSGSSLSSSQEPGGPWMVGNCCGIGHQDWAKDPTNPIFLAWAAGSLKSTAHLLASCCGKALGGHLCTPSTKRGTPATSWVFPSASWCMP